MKSFLRFAPIALVLTSVAHAHPGHDGHELVWEYRGGHVHLDWIAWVVVAALATVAISRYARSQD